MAKERRLTNVTFTGPSPKTQIPEILAGSDACIAILQNIPMFKTTYPNKVFDYMAVGRPTLLAIDGVIRQVIEDSGGGVFVPPGDPEALADAVKWLSENREAAQAMGSAARDYVVANFNREQQAGDFVKLLRQIARTAA